MRRRAFLLGVAALLAWAGVADARMHAPYRGHRIVLAANAVLDGFTAPSGAYSFRKLRTAYAGGAARIRRASDNLELDIGFVGGDFDTSAATTHCAATTCSVVTWYDQSGNARHLTNATPAAQPLLVFNCNGALLCLSMGDSTFTLVGPSVTPATGLVSFSAVGQRTGGFSNFCAWMRQNGVNNRIATSNTSGIWQMLATGAMNGPAVATEGAWHAMQGVLNGASSVVNIDGTEATGTVTGLTTAGAVSISGSTGGGGVTCRLAETIVWDNYALTPAERTALANNQKEYWAPLPLDLFSAPSGAYSFRKLKSTYSGPALRIRRASDNAETDINFLGYVPGLGAPLDVAAANVHCASTTCFLRTWYDQSGNARDVVQATAANQPEYVAACAGALPCARITAATQLLSGGSVTPATGLVSFSGVSNRLVGAGICIWLRQSGSNNRIVAGGANQWLVINTGSVAGVAAEGAFHAAAAVMNGAASVINVDGTETTGTATGATTAGSHQILGAASTTCDYAEEILWDNYALTPAERTVLQSNQKSFWGTP